MNCKKILICIFSIYFLTSSVHVIYIGSGEEVIDTSDLTRLEYFELLENYPYFLNGTILDGTDRVVVSPDGQPPPDMDPEDYDYCISISEMENICGTAREEFINTYGFDPNPPKPDQSNQIAAYEEFIQNEELFTFLGGPHEMYGSIVVKVFPAKNEHDKPADPYELFSATQTGFNHFLPEFQITTWAYYYSGYWDAGDVVSGHIYYYLVDLSEDVDGYLNYDNQVAMGWVKNAYGGTGRSWIKGFFSVAKETTNFPHTGVAQHEISHNFAARDHGWISWPPCVMAYIWLWLEVDDWCNTCHNNMHNQIWNYQ